MEKIVEIKPADDYFSITWRLSIRCNYDCMYCPTTYHDSTSSHHTLETLKNAWINIHHKTKKSKYKISFTGGEPTSNKNFLPFINWLKQEYSNCTFWLLLTTNGSANLKYYTKLFNFIDNISFSVHSEHIDEKKFFEMMINLHNIIDKDKHLHVNIMNEFWNQSRIQYYKELLESNNIQFSVNEINYASQTRTYPLIKGKLNFDI